MKYNGMYYNLFKGPMKKVLKEEYGKEFANQTIKKGKEVYKNIILSTPEMGKGNPMAFNVLFSLVYFAPYIASNKKIELPIFEKMVNKTIDKVKILYTTTNLNTEKMKNKIRKRNKKYIDWYTKEKEGKFPNSFKVDYENIPFENAPYSRITRCPICEMAKKLDVMEIMPYICGLDHIMAHLRHGVLYRKHTIAKNGDFCDFLLLGDQDKSPYNDQN